MWEESNANIYVESKINVIFTEFTHIKNHYYLYINVGCNRKENDMFLTNDFKIIWT